MNESVQGFLLGVTAAIAGILLYVCCNYGSAFLFSETGAEKTADQPKAELVAMEDGTSW